MKRFVLALAAWLHMGTVLAAINVEAGEPRAFGYSVGDVVQRHVVVHASAGLMLDDASLPAVGRRGRALELREMRHVVSREPGGQRHEFRFDYQVFLAPPAARTLEIPSIVLRFRGTPRDEDARIDAWPLTVSPLVPVEVSPRRGLGELQPDAQPPLIDVAPGLRRLAAYAALLVLLLGSLFAVYVVAPWLGRHRRPFERAWRALRSDASGGGAGLRSAEQQRAALRQLHAALNQSAGHVVFAGGVDGFVAMRPQFAPLRDELAAFFGHSQRSFFAAGDATESSDAASLGAWLLALSRRLRDAERGTA